MTSEEIKTNFSKNLIELRKAHNLTQLALAEKLNYSDKAISKWEVGSVIPDVETMARIADFFGITVNDLIYPKKIKLTKRIFTNHIFVSLLSFSLVWFIAAIVFFVLDTATTINRTWLVFIISIPLSFIVLVVFTYLWFKKIWRYLSVTGLFWGTLTTIYLILNHTEYWFIFIIGVVGQILLSFWFGLRFAKKK